MNNKHQELIAKKVAGLIEKVKAINGESVFEAEEKFAYQQGFQDAIAMFYIDLTGTSKTKGVMQDTIDTVLGEEREQMLNRVLEIVDGHKLVYRKGDERFSNKAKDGEEKDHIDSSENETLDDVMTSLIKLKPLDKTPPNKV